MARLFQHWKFLRLPLADPRFHSTGTIRIHFQWYEAVSRLGVEQPA